MKNETARREIESLDFYLQNHTDDYSEESHTAMMMALKALEQEPKWIPVSERLPEDVYGETSDDVLICVTDSLGESQTISTGFYGDYPNSKPDRGWWSMWAYGCSKISDNCKVLAWMPLPKPYEPQERSGEE